ncbi:hypothetical protein DAEQUDRAFT_721257 [Daedalea quercina L-15889]|uniref:Uncharacterized protein n=1 Tax=Daedalea quercina L-15889 TaxID=1314783 RepID=A0A165TQI2_9APHY|nr:hypothetical protein DAEQUDRAFT_721257 [Daedalea quercina L-15889]
MSKHFVFPVNDNQRNRLCLLRSAIFVAGMLMIMTATQQTHIPTRGEKGTNSLLLGIHGLEVDSSTVKRTLPRESTRTSCSVAGSTVLTGSEPSLSQGGPRCAAG